MTILLRQAQDIHRGSTEKRTVFLQGNISANHMSPANTFHHLPEPDAAEGTPQASFRPDSEQIPLIEKAMQHDLQFVQRAGDVVWIPSGWWCALCHYWGFLLSFFFLTFLMSVPSLSWSMLGARKKLGCKDSFAPVVEIGCVFR